MNPLVMALMAAAKLRQGNTLFDGSAADLRISAVDGTAFLDNLPAAALGFVNGRNWVTITDSAGKKLEGVLKAKGTGETLGSELITNGTFDTDTTGWSAASGANLSVVSGQFNVTSSAGDTFSVGYQAKTLATLGLFFFDRVNVSFTSGGASRVDATASSYSPISSDFATVGQKAEYFTYNSAQAYVQLSCAGNGATAIFDNVSLKQVTAPSTSGCTIVDGELSTTENFASVESGFAFNESSYSVTITREREV